MFYKQETNLRLKCIEDNLDLHIVLARSLNKKRRKKKLKKQKIHDKFIKTNYMKLVFNMTWFIEILQI